MTGARAAATLAVVLLLNGLAGAGSLSGESIGVIANRYSSWFLPASYVFSIWSIIYLMLGGFVLYHFLPGRRDRPVLERIGVWWLLNGALNSAWVVLFSFGLYGPSLVVMVLLLASLVRIHVLVGPRGEADRLERFAVHLPFETYLAWISVAVIANSFQYATFLGLDGFGIVAARLSIAMMVVASASAVYMALRRAVWVHPVVLAWALVGIAVRHDDAGFLTRSGWVLAVLCGVVAVFTLVRGRRTL